MVIGLVVYLIRLPAAFHAGLLIVLGALALIGGNLISYSSARAEALGLNLGKPTLASKGTRSSVIIVFALLSAVQAELPLAALVYLVLHPNAVIVGRLIRTAKGGKTQPD
jgi:hypothetical protein